MKSFSVLVSTIALIGPVFCAVAAPSNTPFVYETPHEFFSTGDFNGDGQQDLVIVDKATGKIRLGYGSTNGSVSWPDCRVTGLKGITGFSVGRFLSPKFDALAFAAPDANAFSLVDVSDSTTPTKPNPIQFNEGVGANAIVGLANPSGGSAFDLYVASMLNAAPDVNLAALLRGKSPDYEKVGEEVGSPGTELEFAL